MENKDNPQDGAEFERAVAKFLRSLGMDVTGNFRVDVGVANTQKSHKFDLGQSEPLVLVECKEHTWTKGGNVPSAKMSIWNEAMLYFSASPKRARKMLFVLRSLRKDETLGQYYIRSYAHLIPDGVGIWEFDRQTKQGELIYT